jgi:DNA-binding IclR family transcriptional regulator
MNEPASNEIKSDIKVLQLLESLKDSEGKTITGLSEDLDMAKSTVHAHAHTLANQGYLVRENGEFRLGLRMLDLGGAVQEYHMSNQIIREKVDTLAEETGERAQFVVEEFGEGIYVYCAYGANAVQTNSRIGRRFPLHFSAAGKAILAHMTRDRVEEIVTDGLEKTTENTITEPESLYEELERVREEEFAINEQESTKGLRAIGVPLLRDNGEIIGSISVSGPTHRLKSDILQEEVLNLLLGVANEIELKIAFP